MNNHPPRDLERELQIAEAITSELKPYLLSDVLYMELPRRGFLSQPFPKGTLGGLLFRLHMLDVLAKSVSPDQWQRVAQTRESADQLLRQWAVQTEQKAVREINARLRTWENFIEEAEEDPPRHNVEYASQVENRVIIEHLRGLAEQALDSTLREHIATVDRRLDRISTSGDFVWNDDLRPAFPSEHYDWLYRKLR